MSNQEKRNTSSKTSTLHLRYLASFMDEIDREVVSLTDRAFKSLCIGDEAIYNDSDFSPSHVSCHKPRVEEVPKKTQESLFSAVKKLDSYPLNGVNNALARSNKNTSHFAVFPAKKSNEGTKMTNGDSWDKSALLSIQRELSEFSSDYHSLSMEQLSPVKNNFYSDDKGFAKESSKDSLIPPGKSPKCKHNKNNKLKKLNCINFFLHSEFSPFLSWRDLNTFSIRQDHISEIMLSNRQSEWYDSPLYKELTAAHECYKSQAHPSEKKETEKCPIQVETHQVKVQPESIQSTSPSVPSKPKKEAECVQHEIITEAPLLAAEQRCNSEKVEPCAPWRTNKSRAKSANPVGHSLMTLPVCERTKAGERGAKQIEKEVKTIEEETSASSTPFSISQLLTPVIPSRHGTGTSEILQAVLSSSALEVPPLTEREMYPSPEIRREGYKSIASSVLFNLKDNRKRVKAMYSPPKFKVSDVANQSKESPLPEVSGSKDALGIPEISGAKIISPARQKATISPMSPLLENADPQNCSPQGLTNGGMPDDFLALGLLQSTGSANRPLKSQRSPLVNKVAYPSLQLYRKATPEETHFRANGQTVVDTNSQVFKDKASNPDHIKDQDTQSKLFKELQGKTPNLNTERTPENNSVKSPYASSTKSDEQTSAPEQISNDTEQNKLKTKETFSMQKSLVKEKESNKKEEGSKHLFSARQHNYIKSQRFVNTEDDDNDHDDGSNADKVLMSINDKTCNDELSWHSQNTKEIRQEEHNTVFHQDKVVGAQLLNESVDVKGETTTAKKQSSIISGEQGVKNEAFFMKGNTSAKRAVFASKEQVPNKTTLPQKKDNTIMDKYDLAKMALEEVIAEREQRKLKCKEVPNAEGLLIDRNRQDGHELPTNGEDQQISMLMLSKTKGQNNVSAFKTTRQTVQIMSEDKHGESHEELGIEKKGSAYKPEIPPRRGRSNSESNAGVVEKPIRNKEVKIEDETSVKTEKRESREVSKARRSQSKNRGPVRGNVSALKEKYDKEGEVHQKDVQKRQSAEGTNSKKSKERPNEQPAQAKMKPEQPTIPELTVSPPEIETYSIIHKEIESGNKRTCESPYKTSEKAWEECESQREHSDTQDFQKTINDLTNNRQEIQDCKVNGRENKEEGSVKLKSGDRHSKSKGPCKSHVKEFLNGLLGLSSTEKAKTVDEDEEELTEVALNPFESIKADQSSVTIHDILGQSRSLSSLNGKQTHESGPSSNTNELLHESQQGTLLEHLSSEAEVCNLRGKGKSKEDFSKSPPDNMEKKGWVQCLIESARNLTQISQNHISSKDLLETAQPLPQRESLNGSENGEEDLDLFKECTAIAMPAIPDKSPQSNQQAMYLLSPLSPQPTTVKLSAGSISVSEEEEQRSAVSTLSEEVDSYEASRGDTFEENISSTALTDADGSKAPSERSGSVCSGIDGHGQNKPPAVPPKTEKALRRAMKLNTRRIQKAEAKSKSERKGRSSDKSVCHKPERRHHSTDKIQSDRSEQGSLSSDRHSSEHLSDTPEARTQRSEKHSRRHSSHNKTQNVEESGPCKQLQRAKSQDRQTNKEVESKSNSIEKRQHQKSNHTDHLENGIKNNDTERLSRTNEKSGPRNLQRRTQSLDRFLRDKPESKSTSVEKSGPLSVEEMHCSTSKALPLRQNSNEHTYPPASNVVTPSFPITQRKLLQDPDSGQYFLVDMPVQVKTKTFFDPETKSYVQLPVQSPEGAVRQAPSLEVINTPPLVLYHGFVPVPVSSLPSQKSIIRTSGSMITPDDLDDFETGKKQMQDDFYQKKEMNSYIEPAYVSQEHTLEDEIDSVR